MDSDTSKNNPEEKKPEAADTKPAGNALMEVKAYSPFKTYFEGEATSVSAESATGPFDVLGRHHNFITLLVPCDIVVRTPKGDETISIGGGIMHVKADKVIIFLDV
jgi:F0F1-type ATP synthase epsilon subunit